MERSTLGEPRESIHNSITIKINEPKAVKRVKTVRTFPMHPAERGVADYDDLYDSKFISFDRGVLLYSE
jgi:hypothetical protein